MTAASARLQAAMNQNLIARLPHGSTLFSMTWKVRVTPALRPISRLQASARRTSDNGYGSWPSPTAQPANGTPEAFLQRKRNAIAKGSSMGVCLSDIGVVAQLTHWPTPTALEQHDTPEKKRARGSHVGLNLTVAASWATPTTRDHKDGDAQSCANVPVNSLLGRPVTGTISSGSPAETAKPGQLNPAFSRWLMGYPAAWDDCAATATPSSRKSRPKSSKRTAK